LTTAVHALALKGDVLPKIMVSTRDEHDTIAEAALIADGSSTRKERRAKSDETYLWINAYQIIKHPVVINT
jgi:hypothetical protein